MKLRHFFIIMGCTFSKAESYSKKNIASPSSILIRTRENYSIPVRFFNLDKEYTLVVCHGVSESFKSICEWVESNVVSLGLVNILVFEYYASNENNENVNESCIYSDCEAVMWFLTECLRLSKRKIFLYGRCIGAGVSLFLAERYPDIAGLILQSSLVYSLRITYTFKLSFPREFYLSLETLKKIQCPLVFLHGSHDETTPIKVIKDLYDGIKNPRKKLLQVDGTHVLTTEVVQCITELVQGMNGS